MDDTSLEKSLRNFSEKKSLGLELLGEILQAREDFDAILPELGSSADENGRLGKKEILQAMTRLRDEKLKILFAGQFKTGKSTLINAMLGQKVLPADPLPCTAVITEIEYAKTPRAILHFKKDAASAGSGQCAEVDSHMAKYSGQDIPPLEVSLCDESSLEEYLAIKDFGKDEAQGIKETPLARCVVYWPLELCRNGAVIIDSPGLNEADARDRTTLDYVGSADIIVHALHAIQLCGMPDRDFIARVKMNGNLPILFAVNRFDQLNTDAEREKIRKNALGHSLLQNEYGENGIFFTSALAALDARVSNDPEKLAASGVPELESQIAHIFETERTKIKLGCIKQILGDLDAFTGQNLPALLAGLNSDVEELENEYASKHGEFAALDEKVERMQENVAKCLDNFSDDLEARAENFFRLFAGAPLENIVAKAKTSRISFWDRKEDMRAVGEELCIEVGEGIQDALLEWLASDGEKIYRRCMHAIGEVINSDLQDFAKSLASLQKELKLGRLSVNERALNMNAGIFLNELGNVGMTVGGIGAGLVFAGERFLPALISGPWGWGLMLAATAGSLLWTATTGSRKAQMRFKELFVKEIRKKLERDIPALTGMLVREMTLKIREEMIPVFKNLNQSIDDTKKPIENAIRVLQANRDSLQEKKALLGDIIARFEGLAQKGRALAETLQQPATSAHATDY